MTLPVYPNAISADDIRTEFALGGALSMNGLYRNDNGPVYTGVYGYPQGNVKEPVTSGTIAFDDFHGATRYVPQARSVTLYAGSGTWTVPHTVISELQVSAFGGGGGGARWPSGAPGGAGGGGAMYRGTIPRGTTISYTVATGGPAVYGDSSRYARDAGNTAFGSPSDIWYLYISGFNTGAYNMSGSVRGPGVGSTGTGGAGLYYYGTGGAGGPERSSVGGNATGQYGGYGGGGGASAYGTGGLGGGGGGNGGNAASNGNWPGGGAGGIDGGWSYAGADGAIIISGYW